MCPCEDKAELGCILPAGLDSNFRKIKYLDIYKKVFFNERKSLILEIAKLIILSC